MIRRILILAAMLVPGLKVAANHVLGGNITWTCVGAGQYEVTFTLYKDCYGTPGDPSTEVLFFYPAGCGESPFSVDLDFVSAVEISDLCPSELIASSCSGGLAPGTMQVTYTDIVTLPAGCTWQLIWNNGDWNFFQNMDNFGGGGNPVNAFINSFIDTSAPCDDSASINSSSADSQVPYICLGDPYVHSISVDNPNAYDLTFSLGPCLTTGGTPDAPITAPGYITPTGMTINTLTGEINWPVAGPQLGTYVVCVNIEMWDGATYMGTLHENMVFVVRNCVPTSTYFEIPNITSVYAETTLINGNAVEVCAGDSLNFTVTAHNDDLTKAITLSYSPMPVPGLTGMTFAQNGINPAVGSFSLQTTGAHIGGPYAVTIMAVDNACPNPDTAYVTVNITVHSNIELNLSDTTICDGQSVNLIANGQAGNDYTWFVLSGDAGSGLSGSGPSQIVSPDTTTVYRVYNALVPASCHEDDTVTVHVSLSDITVDAVDETCGLVNGSITVEVVGDGSGDYNFDWNNGGSTNDPASLTGLNGGLTVYNVTVTDNVYGCTTNGGGLVGDVPAPVATFTGGGTYCEGGDVDATITLTQGEDPFTVVWSGTPPPGTWTGLTSPELFTLSDPGSTTFTIDSIIDASGCGANVNLIITTTERPYVTATLSVLPNDTICLGESVDIELAFSAAGVYDVVYTSEGTSGIAANNMSNPVNDIITITPNTLGAWYFDIDAVEYDDDNPSCPSADITNDSLIIQVNPAPTATITGGNTICEGGSQNLTFTASNGPGPWTVSYTANSIAQTDVVVPVGGSLSLPFMPADTTIYCISSVANLLCVNNTVSSCDTINVVPFPVVDFYIDDLELCQGDTTQLHITVSPEGFWFAGFTENDSEFASAFAHQGSDIIPNFPFVYNIHPNQTSYYELDVVYFEEAPACSTIVNEQITVNVNGSISVIDTAITCNTAVTPYEYQAVFTLSGGEAPYEENDISFVGNTYTTSWFVENVDSTWHFSDANDCNLITITLDHDCPTVTEAGSMSATALQLCGTDPANGTFNNNAVLDDNDEHIFMLVTDPASLATIFNTDVQVNPTSPQFTFDDLIMDYGTTYYIVSVVGDSDGNGGVDPATVAPYIDFSSAQAVTWYEEPTVEILAEDGDNAACAGDSVVILLDFTGTGPWAYSYSVDGGTPVTGTAAADSATFNAGDPGIYVIESVSSGPGNLCPGTFSGSVNVIIDPLPTITFDGDADTCAGLLHCFTLEMAIGTGPFDVEIDNPVGANSDLIGIADGHLYCVGDEGDYQVISITDANGCVNDDPLAMATLTINDLPTVTWSSDTTDFCEGASVDISVDLTGASPFDLNITSPGNVIGNPVDDALDGEWFNVNVEGDYIINSVTDDNGCVSETGDAIYVDQIDTPVADAGPDLEQCIDLDVQIGTAAVNGQTYEWNPSTHFTTPATDAQPIVNSPDAGTFEYFVTATVGDCAATDSMTLTVFSIPDIGITALADSLCNNECTTLTAAAPGTVAYEWTGGNGLVGPLNTASVQACPDSTGFFLVEVTETHPLVQCVAQDSIQIFIGDSIMVAEDFTEEICYGTCEGEISLLIVGGFPPYTITGDIMSADTVGLCPGIYNYEITDAIGCLLTGGSIEIVEREPEVIDQIIITNPVCAYELGSIQVIDNATSVHLEAVPCEYGLTLPGPDALFSDLSPCEYLVQAVFEVDPGVFCETDSIVEIESISSAISFNSLWTNEDFCFEEEACFDGVPAGGTGGLDIEWYADEDLTQMVSTSEPYCVALTDSLVLYGVAIDQLFCHSDTVEVFANVYPDITLEIQSGADTTFICEYSCADLVAETGGGANDIVVTWFELPADIPITIPYCPYFETTIYAIASDGCSESATDTVVVHVWDTPEVIFEADTIEGCFPLTVTFTDLSIPIADDVTCVWSFGEGSTLGVCDTVDFTYALPLLYAEYYPALTITSEHGCVGTDTLEIPIVVHGYPEVDFTWEPQPVTVLEHEVQFFNLSEGAETYNWNFYGVATDQAPDPIWDFPVLDEGVFPVCLEATTEFGCSAELCQDIIVEGILQVFVPNVFTPDGDNINDLFKPIITGARPGTYRFWIFNRWGDPLFYTEDPDMAWTGGSDGGAFYVQNDSFVWRIEVEGITDGKIEVFEGTVTIVR